jgi:hypothetical protein
VRFLTWLGRSPIASAFKVGISVILAMAVAEWTQSGTIAFDKWQTWVIAACASSLPVIVNYLNPTDDRYGSVSERTATPDGEKDPIPNG